MIPMGWGHFLREDTDPGPNGRLGLFAARYEFIDRIDGYFVSWWKPAGAVRSPAVTKGKTYAGVPTPVGERAAIYWVAATGRLDGKDLSDRQWSTVHRWLLTYGKKYHD